MTTSKKSSNKSSTNNDFYAIAETSGQQFWFEVDKYYDIDRLNAKEKDKITLEKVLLIKDKDSISLGKPYIKDARIELEVVSHLRDKKIIIPRSDFIFKKDDRVVFIVKKDSISLVEMLQII